MVGAGDDGKSGNRVSLEEDSCDLRGSLRSKEVEVDESVANDSIVIDVMPRQGLDGSSDREKLCRICHLSSERGSGASKVADELILLGCGCKGELGMAHRRCADAWFKLRRSRLCEICGETAENVSGAEDNGLFMEEWNDGRGRAVTSTSSSEGGGGGGGCSRQPLCNLLIACVVMAFILPWFFFRVDLI